MPNTVCDPNRCLGGGGQTYSNWAPVTSGAPYGSVIGSLLFLIYINYLDTNIVSICKIYKKFADDTKLCHRARNPDDMTELQKDIDKLGKWANKWQMNFNDDKCSVMHIGHNKMEDNYNMSNQ